MNQKEKLLSAIVVYTEPSCPYCSRAMRLLTQKGVDFTEIVAANDPAKKAEMIKRSNGARTFPQIFIGERHIGGCDDMVALNRRGELDKLLGL